MMLVLPAYVLQDVDFGRAVLLAEAVAVAALIMCLGFVVVDIGNPLAWLAPHAGHRAISTGPARCWPGT